jgi:drug/metabolite transporter (DMT)-like permease
MTARHHAHIPARAVLLIAGAVLCFSVLDTCVKYVSPRYPVPLLVWARWTVQAVAMLLWLAPTMRLDLVRTPQLRTQVIRGFLLIGSSVMFVTALKYLPLAEVTALNYTTPTVVILLAVAFLHEKMTRPRAALVVAGIVGMLLIVRPGAEMFQGAAALALGSAACYAVYQILTRKLAGEDPRVTLFYPALVGTLLSSLLLPWTGMPSHFYWVDVFLILFGGLLGTLGHFLFILAFQRAPASGLTPFTYMQLVWSTLLGWIVFGQFPDGFTLLGMAIIAGSGLALALYERRHALTLPPARDPTALD